MNVEKLYCNLQRIIKMSELLKWVWLFTQVAFVLTTAFVVGAAMSGVKL